MSTNLYTFLLSIFKLFAQDNPWQLTCRRRRSPRSVCFSPRTRPPSTGWGRRSHCARDILDSPCGAARHRRNGVRHRALHTRVVSFTSTIWFWQGSTRDSRSEEWKNEMWVWGTNIELKTKRKNKWFTYETMNEGMNEWVNEWNNKWTIVQQIA